MKRLFATCLVLSTAALASAQVAPNSQADQQAPAKPAEKAADERVIVTRPMVPVPEVGDGAPYHSVEDLKAQGKGAQDERAEASIAARKCQPGGSLPTYFANAPTFEVLFRDETAAALMLGGASSNAAKATEAALKARADAAEGLVDMKTVEKAELDRQAAIAVMDKAQDKWLRAYNRTADAQDLVLSGRARDLSWSELDLREAQRRRFTAEDMKEEFAGLKLTEVKAVEVRDTKDGERFLRVSGKIVNNRTASVSVPAIFISAVDERGFPLVTRKANTGRGQQLRAGGVASPFMYDLKPLPFGSVTAVVHLASKATPPPHLDPNMFCGEGAFAAQE